MDRLRNVARRLSEEPLTGELIIETLDAIEETLQEMRRLQALPGQIADALIEASDEPRPNRRGWINP